MKKNVNFFNRWSLAFIMGVLVFTSCMTASAKAIPMGDAFDNASLSNIPDRIISSNAVSADETRFMQATDVIQALESLRFADVNARKDLRAFAVANLVGGNHINSAANIPADLIEDSVNPRAGISVLKMPNLGVLATTTL